MRYQNELLPSKEESKIETQKRLDILNDIKPELEKFCEIVIVAGSVGYGKNFSVRKESDIDLIILINRENVEEIFKSPLFRITPQIKEAISYFKKKEVDHFSIIKEIKGVEVQFHFWDKEAHFRAELLKSPPPRVYGVWNRNPRLRGKDFLGKERIKNIPVLIKCKYGKIHEFPSYFIKEGCFVPLQPLLNLITDPDILFCKDKTLFDNIEKIWEMLSKRLVKESEGHVDLKKRNILFSIYGDWNISKESMKKIKEKISKIKKGEILFKKI